MKYKYFKEVKIINAGVFYVDKSTDYFCAYQDGRCTFKVIEYSNLMNKKDLYMNNLEEPCKEEPFRIIIEGCDDTIYGKRYSSPDCYELQKLIRLLKSGKVLKSKKLIDDYQLICYN